MVTNSQPEATLKKKHAAINFQRVREAIAAGTIKVAKEGTQTNLADIFVKIDARFKNERVVGIHFMVTATGDKKPGDTARRLSRNSRSHSGFGEEWQVGPLYSVFVILCVDFASAREPESPMSHFECTGAGTVDC